jgi:uncharacterized protein (DUF1800 family)
VSGVTRRQLFKKPHPRKSAPALQLAPPERLHCVKVTSSLVAIAWRRSHDHGPRVHYEVLRDGRRLAHVRTPRFDDRRVSPGTAYRYTVRAIDGDRDSKRSRILFVKTPATAAAAVVAATPAPPPPPPPPPPTLTQAMVDRLFWRAGFGPSDAERAQWTGQPVSALVDFLVSAPNVLAPSTTPPTYYGNPIDPLDSDDELQMEWLDVMTRSTNPFVERLTFFWHRHFAVSKDAGIDSPTLLAYRDRLRRYADFATTPTASFHDLAVEMTTQDAAMSLYLTGFENVKSSPNENYAREFMELFTLGVTDANGNPNYTQTDVHNLARAFTGYQLNQSSSPGVVTFTPQLADRGTKTILGQTAKFDALGAVALVLSQPSHAPFLVSELWNEFIAEPIPADALASLTSIYLQGATTLQPLLRGILSHPLIFDSLDEPAMIKSPVVYTVGVLRATGAPLQAVQTDALADMLQQPYHPPNVAGWPGGLAWMTTGTSVARFSLIPECQGTMASLTDIPAETPDQAYARAYAAVGSPWLSAATQAALQSLAATAPATRSSQRLERQYALRSLMLGGPDGQVM